MANYPDQTNNQHVPPPVETDYEKHEDHPGPSPEAVFEHNDEGAGQALKWIVPPILLCLLIFWLIFKL